MTDTIITAATITGFATWGGAAIMCVAWATNKEGRKIMGFVIRVFIAVLVLLAVRYASGSPAWVITAAYLTGAAQMLLHDLKET